MCHKNFNNNKENTLKYKGKFGIPADQLKCTHAISHVVLSHVQHTNKHLLQEGMIQWKVGRNRHYENLAVLVYIEKEEQFVSEP